MNEEEMISEIEIYLSHVVAKDFPFPKAVKLMYEEYKNSNKAWEKIHDEDQNYIVELNDKILDLEFKIKNQQKEIKRLEKESIGSTKYERLLFSIRMLHFHHYINDNQFIKMINKLSNENEGE